MLIIYFIQQSNICLNTSNIINSKNLSHRLEDSIPVLYYNDISFILTFQYSSISCSHYKTVHANVQFNLCAKRLHSHQPHDGC